jgi:hypothetical protein
MTLADAIISPTAAASLLRIGAAQGKEIAVPVSSLINRTRGSGRAKGHAAQATGRKSRRSRTRNAAQSR